MACTVMKPLDGRNIINDAKSGGHLKSPSYTRIASSVSVSSIASLPVHNTLPNLSLSDIRKRLSDLIQSKGPDLIQACKNFDRRATKKIPKAQFRQVLRTFCFPITAVQFDLLCKDLLQINQGGKLSYIDFFNKLSNGKDLVIQGTPALIPLDLSIDEVELRIKEKITSKLYDIIRAFWLFDINKDGLIQKAELRRIIRNYCFDISDEQYNKLWKTYDPKGTGVIRYEEFLIKIGINSDRYKKYMPSDTVARALCWSDKKAKAMVDDLTCEQKSRRAALEHKDDPAVQGLTLEEAIEVFLDRLLRRAQVLKDSFKLFDNEKNGQISVTDFHGVLNFFVMAMSPGLFKTIAKRLDICSSPECKIKYVDFLNTYCKIVTKQKELLKRDSRKLECHPIVQTIKNHVMNPCSRLQAVFTKINPDSNWQITRLELKRAIEMGFDYKMSEEEFKDLLELLDPGNTNMINCVDFLRLFDPPKTENSECNASALEDNFCSGEEDYYGADEGVGDKYVNTSGKKLKSKMKHHINKNRANLERAFLVCDPSQCGFIPLKRLQDILDTYCFSISDDQFKELISPIKLYGDSLNYREFMHFYKKMPNEDACKWVATVKKLATYKSRCPPALPVDEVEELLRECVHARKTTMLKDFMALDACNVGVVCKSDVKCVLNKFSFRFNDQQFEELWKKFPRNKFNQLIYEVFLEEYSKLPYDESQVKLKQPSPKVVHEPCKMHPEVPRQPKGPRKSAKELVFTTAPHLKPLFDSMEPAIVRNYRTIRFHLQRADKKNCGSVKFETLKVILLKSGIFLTNENEFHLLEYFDPYLSGTINYHDFLRIFVWFA